MGDAADDAYNAWLTSDENVFSDLPKRRGFQSGTGNYMWRQADGTVIDMHTMTNEHISNAIRICEKYNNSGKKTQLEQILRDRMNV